MESEKFSKSAYAFQKFVYFWKVFVCILVFIMDKREFEEESIKYVESRITLISLLENYDFNFIREKNSFGSFIIYQSRLIENILLDIPLPKFYLHEFQNYSICPIDKLNDNTLIALKKFVNGDFRLQNLEYLPYNNFTFKDLPPEKQRKIYWKEVDIVTFSKWTPAPILYNLYKKVAGANLIFDIFDFEVVKDYLKYFKDILQKYELTEIDLLIFLSLYLSSFNEKDKYEIEDLKEFILNTLYNFPIKKIEPIVEEIKNHLELICNISGGKNMSIAIIVYCELHKRNKIVDKTIFLGYLNEFEKSLYLQKSFVAKYKKIRKNINYDYNNKSSKLQILA